jgi:hypothetical protein
MHKFVNGGPATNLDFLRSGNSPVISMRDAASELYMFVNRQVIGISGRVVVLLVNYYGN